MTFVNDQNEVLEVPGEVAITKQAVSFFGFKIKGDYSVNFTVPNNSVTRDILNYEGPQMTSQVAFTRQSFTLMRDGNPFLRGSIVIQDDDGDMLDCYFVSGNSNWINLVQGLITELDYSGVTNGTNYEITTLNGFIVTKNVTSGVIFPLIDWQFNYNKGSNYWNDGFINDSQYDATTIIPTTPTIPSMYPCFFLKTLVQEIAQQAGIKIAGNILNDRLYQSAIITPSDGDITRAKDYKVTAFGSTVSLTSGVATSTGIYTSEIDDEGFFDPTTGIYIPTLSGAIIVKFRYTCAEACNFTLVRISDSSVAVTASGASGDTIIAFGFVLAGVQYQAKVTDTIWSAPINFKLERLDMYFVKKLALSPFGYDYVRPDSFLPSLNQIDILKYVVSSFGAIAYYNDASKTVNVNILESMKEADALNWSDYHISHRSEYTVQYAKNNYLRLEDSEESDISSYDKTKATKYGEANLQTGIRLKDSFDAYKSPFSATGFGLCKNGFYQANVPLISLTDAERTQQGNTSGPVVQGQFFSIVNNAGIARLTGYITDGTNPGSFTGFATVEVVRVVIGSTDYGYFVIRAVDANKGWIECQNLLYTVNTTGQVYKQTAKFNKINPRILFLNNSNVPDVSSSSNVNYSGTTTTTAPVAWFVKPKTNLGIDNVRAGLHYDNPDIDSFTDPPMKDLYFRRINNIFNNPPIRMKMLLPEAVFQSYQFDKLIRVQAEDLDGYFFPESIVNYQDGNTPVEVNFYML